MSIPIRRLSTNQPDIIWQNSSHEIADLIAKGHAEPVITLGEHNPPVPSEGLSLAEAFGSYIDQHPDLRQHNDARIVGPTIALRKFVERPTWSGTADIDKLRRLAGLEPLKARGGQARGAGAIPESSPGPRVIRVDELDKELQKQIGRFRLNLVVHDFLTRLLNGRLQATGVWEGDLATLERQDVPGNWWSRDIVVRIPDCEIWERTARDRRPGSRRWSAVKVESIDNAAVVGAADTSAPLRSGMPGRPSSMHLIEKEFRRRAKVGSIEPKLKIQAEVLTKWLEEAHPDAPPATPKTIENRLRPLYRSETKKRS